MLKGRDLFCRFLPGHKNIPSGYDEKNESDSNFHRIRCSENGNGMTPFDMPDPFPKIQPPIDEKTGSEPNVV